MGGKKKYPDFLEVIRPWFELEKPSLFTSESLQKSDERCDLGSHPCNNRPDASIYLVVISPVPDIH